VSLVQNFERKIIGNQTNYTKSFKEKLFNAIAKFGILKNAIAKFGILKNVIANLKFS
jgi:hypothetical protein